MHAENPLVYHGTYRESVEAFSELLPSSHRVPPFALVVKAVHPVDRLALVVASQQVELLGVLDFIREQKYDGLNALLSSVHVVAYEEELLVTSGEAGNVEKPKQIEILAVDIPENFDRRL